MPRSKKQRQYLCIVDYNLSRVGDVKMLTEYAKTKYNLDSILIRANPNHIDQSLADIVINLGPRQDHFVNQALHLLYSYANQIVAVLPFSDDSVVVGSALAEALGLATDNSKLAKRAFSKWSYRQAENAFRAEFEAQNLFIPRSQTIHNKEELNRCLQEWGELVLKPTSEGNNRGVIRLNKKDSIGPAFTEVSSYIAGGLIAEEVIPLSQEFSVDGVGSLTFCTRKLGHLGRYPVECGQMVPAQITKVSENSILQAAQLANLLVGQNIGPFHNEIKHDPQSLQSAVVEPNRRPAGMRIWHLAEKAYGINFFHLWIDQLMGQQIPNQLPNLQKLAGIRMLKSPQNGVLTFGSIHKNETASLINSITTKVAAKSGIKFEVFDFQWNTSMGSVVFNEPKDNSQFIAQVCFSSTDLNINMEEIMNKWAVEFEIQIQPFIRPNSEQNQATEVL